MSLHPQLPAFGWKSHGEQVGLAALEANAWHMSTVMLIGYTVKTALVQPPTDAMKRGIEAMVAHARECKNARCAIKLSRGITALVGDDGKYRDDLKVFLTLVTTEAGEPLIETSASSFSVEEAVSNHYAAVALIAGALADWKKEIVAERV